MGRLLSEIKVIGSGSEGEVTYLVNDYGKTREVTITEEEREALKTENYYTSGEFLLKARAKVFLGSEDAGSMARIKDISLSFWNPDGPFSRGEFLKKNREFEKLCREYDIKREVLREEWDEQNKKGKPFWTRLWLRNPYYIPSSGGDTSAGVE